MSWTNTGTFFQMFDQHDTVVVTSTAHSGLNPLPPGAERFQINASGHWHVAIAPPAATSRGQP